MNWCAPLSHEDVWPDDWKAMYGNIEALDLVDVSQPYTAGKPCETTIRAWERARVVAFLRQSIHEGLDSPNPGSAVAILADRIEKNEF